MREVVNRTPARPTTYPDPSSGAYHAAHTRRDPGLNEGTAELARRFNISEPTVAKWKARTSVADLSHRPHKLSTTLSPAQEAIVVELRRLLLLPLDDLLIITREFICADMSRGALDRCLRRHG